MHGTDKMRLSMVDKSVMVAVYIGIKILNKTKTTLMCLQRKYIVVFRIIYCSH